MNNHQVLIDRHKCIGCGLCAKTCAAKNIAIENKKANTMFSDCMMCGQCSAICPKQAIELSGYDDVQVENKQSVTLPPNDVLSIIRFRRSIRNFQDKRIPREVITQILEAGRLTHTAKNKQDVSFVVLDKQKDKLEQMAVQLFRKIKPIANMFSVMAKHNEINDHFFFFKAPIAIVIMAENKENGILAAQNMEFVAEANGLGVLYSGFFTMAANTSRKMRRTLQVPKKKKVAMTLVLGYPAISYMRSPKREALVVRYM